jgi:hypothetical protein
MQLRYYSVVPPPPSPITAARLARAAAGLAEEATLAARRSASVKVRAPSNAGEIGCK